MAARFGARQALTFVSVCTTDRLAAARALAESARAFHPDVRFVLWWIDPVTRGEIVGVESRSVDELRIHDWHRFTFQYTALELCCAIKPHALLHVLSETSGTACVYLDTDVLLYAPLDEMVEHLDDAAIVLVPHLVAPTEDPGREREVVKHGVYNGGVLGVRPSDSGRGFLRWWRERTRQHCIADADGHLFMDQYWLALVPSLFDGATILRHPGYDAAYWNVVERPIMRDRSRQWCVAGQPLRLFHFSGFETANPQRLSRYSPLLAPAGSDLEALLTDYAVRVSEWSWLTPPSYRYSTLTDGTPIDPRWRELIRVNHPSFAGVENPFDVEATPDLVNRFRAHETDVGCRVGWDPTDPRSNSGRVTTT